MSVPWPDYELLDFGAGRKLERFGACVIDRPCPAGQHVKWTQPDEWKRTGLFYDGPGAMQGTWGAIGKRGIDADAIATLPNTTAEIDVPLPSGRAFRMRVRPLPSGQVGVFPEQHSSWRWLADRCAGAATPLKVLNAFAYTGGSTLACAAGGAEMVHVDAAHSSVLLARENAKLSGLADHTIRWIVEDALKFCRREAKRGNRYDAVILDPPTYGHGPKGEEWQIKRDLLPLLEVCGELVERRPKFVLLTCHTPGIGPAELSAYLADGIFGHCGQPPRTGELALETADGRRLPSGVFARWPG
jgi:23S rRNA (cytosine1962-C5)-methyltransferase